MPFARFKIAYEDLFLKRTNLKSPWRTLKGGPESIALEPKLTPATKSWWMAYASPETTFEEFSAAAHARDVAMSQSSWTWRAQKAMPNT